MVAFEKKVLANGLTVLHEKRDVPVTTVMLATKYGSAYESEDEKGLAHFIEHLCFKGTEKRNAKEIAETVEKVGGDLNAFTHEEVTAYQVKLPSEHLGLAMDVVFDIFFNPVFPEEEVVKEANVICEEIRMYKDNPRFHVLDEIKGCLYESPFGMSIAGTEENVRGFDRDKIFGRHREVYCPANAVLCVVGNNSLDEVISFAEKFCVEREFNFEDSVEVKEVYSEKEEFRANLQQTNLALGFHFPLAGSKERFAAEIFSAILGEGMSSRLFTEVREKRGLVYGVKTDLELGKDYGYLLIWAGTDPKKTSEVVEICLKEFDSMNNLTEKELDEAKEQVIGNHKVNSEGSVETAVNLILEEISSDANGYYEYEKDIRAVSLKEVKDLAKRAGFAKFVLGPKV